MNTLNSGSFWLGYSHLSYFPSRKQDFHPEVFLSVWLPLEIMATFLYPTRVLFFAVHTRCRHRFTLECHNPMLFLLPGYASQNYSHSQSPVPITDNFFFKKGYRGHYRECWRHESPRGSGVQLNLGAPKRYFQHLSWDMSAKNRPRRSVIWKGRCFQWLQVFISEVLLIWKITCIQALVH